MNPAEPAPWKSQLEKWLNDGLSEVTRHCSEDGEVCERCRELAEEGFNIFKIEHLLELDDPMNEDPHSSKALCSAGTCRCVFKPMVGRKFMDDI